MHHLLQTKYFDYFCVIVRAINIIYTRQMDFKLNTGSCCMGKKGCSKIQNNKLNTYDWLCDVPDAANATDYVEVQFKNTRKGYYLNSSKIPLEKEI